jgi:hypothetical protein
VSRTDGRRLWSPRAGDERDPWRGTPTSELQDQVLPRWFVLTALVMVPLAVVAVVAAFLVAGPDEVPLGARRPPPADGWTHAVGEVDAGTSAPQPLTNACPLLDGLQIAGAEEDLARLRAGLATLCGADLDATATGALRGLAERGTAVRFAVFGDTGVDSTASLEDPLVLVNARFSRTQPALIAPLVVHEAVTLAGDPGTAATELAARTAEDAACRLLPPDGDRSRACADAAALLAEPDPSALLREAGYR